MKKLLMLIIGLVLVGLPVHMLAQPAATPAPPAVPEGEPDLAWKARHDKMVAEMQAMDARLHEKLAAMNAVTGDQKIEAMAAVINELVAQRKAMTEGFGPMHHGMKCPRMGHPAGMPPDCPMMKQPVGPAHTLKKEGTP